jgi:hypothetical protein
VTAAAQLASVSRTGLMLSMRGGGLPVTVKTPGICVAGTIHSAPSRLGLMTKTR